MILIILLKRSQSINNSEPFSIIASLILTSFDQFNKSESFEQFTSSLKILINLSYMKH